MRVLIGSVLLICALFTACSEDAPVVAVEMGQQPTLDMRALGEDMRRVDDMREPLKDMALPEDMRPAQDMRAAQDMRPQEDMRVVVDMGAPDQGLPTGELYKGSAPVYTKGPLAVSVKQAQGSPAPVTIYAPSAAGQYPVVIFQHGFLLATGHYSDMLEHIASHGFIVVAPQMYAAGGLPFGKPNTDQETALAVQVLAWVKASLGAQLQGVTARTELIGLVGHSRGSKVIWKMLVGGERVQAVVGLDPVDGTGGPLGGEMRVAGAPFNFSIPTLIIGTGLGPMGSGPFQPACAPAGDNHEQFYAAAKSPAYHIVMTEHGHLDMLNDRPSPCGLECTSCPSGPMRAPMRAASAGLVVSLMRAQLQGVPDAQAVLSQTMGAPVVMSAEQK